MWLAFVSRESRCKQESDAWRASSRAKAEAQRLRWGAGLTPQQALQSNTDRWMMIDSSQVSLDGSECNKIGVGYAAFRYQTVRACAIARVPFAPCALLCFAFQALHIFERHACLPRSPT